MTARPAESTYARVRTAVWRDTGTLVLTLATDTQPRSVLALHGLGAALWRSLADPRTWAELRELLGAEAPLAAALDDLVRAGLVTTTERGDSR